jgi:sarcosine oxidase subunit beta
MPGRIDECDVAVVGAGAIGLSVAGQVARMGGGRVVVFEGLPAVGHGSSSRANGGVRAQFTTAVNVAFSLHSIRRFEELQSEHGDRLGFRQVGYLLFTADAGRLEALETAVALQRSMGVETDVLTPPEILRRAPFVRPDGLLAGTFHARDGLIDPHGVVSVLASEARDAGVDLRPGEAVVDLVAVDGGASFDAVTAARRTRAAWVVNAAGAYARGVAAMLGVDVAVEPVRRNLAFFESPVNPRDQTAGMPMCVDLDTGVLVRREGADGVVVAYSDPNDPPSRETTLDPAFLPALAERVGNRFPFLQDLPADPARCWAGLYPETPDHLAIIGPSPGLPRFAQCVGFGGHGLMHAPAAGRAVAELMVKGRCDAFDLSPLRPSRFEEGDIAREAAVF